MNVPMETSSPHYRITRSIEFCYGHRLLDYEGKCRHLHGHNGLLEVDVAADVLDEVGMVADFSRVRDLVKDWVDAHMDHRMVLSPNPPKDTDGRREESGRGG